MRESYEGTGCMRESGALTIADTPAAGGERPAEHSPIARAIADLKAIAPKLGEAAEHPLTEWFFMAPVRAVQAESVRKGSRISYFFWTRLVMVITYGVIYAWAPTMYKSICFLPFMLAIVATDVVQRRSKAGGWSGKATARMAPRSAGAMLLGDRMQREQLWLTGVSYRDIVGIFVGCEFVARFPLGVEQRRRNLARVWQFPLMIALATAIARVPGAEWVHLICAGLAVMWSFHLWRGDPVVVAGMTLKDANNLIPRAKDQDFRRGTHRDLISIANIPIVLVIATVMLKLNEYWPAWIAAAGWVLGAWLEKRYYHAAKLDLEFEDVVGRRAADLEEIQAAGRVE